MHHPVHKTLKAAYSFYNVAFKTSWIELMSDALVVAKNVSFNSLKIESSDIFIEMFYFPAARTDTPL